MSELEERLRARVAELEAQVDGIRLDVITQVDAHGVTRAELARVTQADAYYQAEALRLNIELAAIKALEPEKSTLSPKMQAIADECENLAALANTLTAAPAAPAADALYEALRQITREYIRTCVQLNGDKEEEMQDVVCVIAANKALAAHRAAPAPGGE